MQVQECMSNEVRTISPDDTVRAAAQLMATCDTGILPVAENDRLVGMLTDRDIAIRVVAAGLDADCAVREAMSDQIKYCYEDQEVSAVAENMAEIQVRRLPVLNRDKRLVGIVSLCDIAKADGAGTIGQAVSGITRPGGQHTHAML